MLKKYTPLAIIIILALVVVAYYLIFNNDIAQTYSVISTNSTSTTVKPLHSATKPYSASKISPSLIASSSTTTVGEYKVVVNCTDFNPTSVQIFKEDSVIQTLSIQATISGITSCVPAESQDINFDGYPDLMVPTDDGSGGTSEEYWLYSTSTDEFTCPEANGDCNLMNPTFDPVTKTVISTDSMSANSIDTKTYKVVEGKLILASDSQNP